MDSALSLEILQHWCLQNGFDPFRDWGLRPASFLHGVRGIQGIPQTSPQFLQINPYIDDSSVTPNNVNTDASNILNLTYQDKWAHFDRHVQQFIPSIHAQRNNVQFTTNSEVIDTQDETNDSDHDLNRFNFNLNKSTPNITSSNLFSNGCYSYHQCNDNLSSTYSPIVQIPYHLMLSPSRFLYSNPLLLQLVSIISTHHLHDQEQLSFLQYKHPPSSTSTFSTPIIQHIFLSYLFDVDNMTLRLQLQDIFKSSSFLDQLYNTLFPPHSKLTPLLSDLDVLILSILENLSAFKYLFQSYPCPSNLSIDQNNPNSTPTTQQTTHTQIIQALTNPSSINCFPYITALPRTYDQSVNWSWDQIDLITFSNRLANPHLYTDLISRFCEWVRLNLILTTTAILFISKLPSTDQQRELHLSFLQLHLFHNFNTLSTPLFSFSDYLYAYSTVATRSVYTPVPTSQTTLSLTTASLHFPYPKQLAETINILSSTTFSSKFKLGKKDQQQLFESTGTNEEEIDLFSQLCSIFHKTFASSSFSSSLNDALITTFLYLTNASQGETLEKMCSNARPMHVFEHFCMLYPIQAQSLPNSGPSTSYIKFITIAIQALTCIASDKIHVYQKHNYTRFDAIALSVLNLSTLHAPTVSLNTPINPPAIDIHNAILMATQLRAQNTSKNNYTSNFLLFETNSKLTFSQPLLPFSDQALIPFFDLLNHSDQISVEVRWDSSSASSASNLNSILFSTSEESSLISSVSKKTPNCKDSHTFSQVSPILYSILRNPITSISTAYPVYNYTPLNKKIVNSNSSPLEFESDPRSEVFISYGPLSNLDLFQRYGFALSQNKHDTISISKSFIDQSIKTTLDQLNLAFISTTSNSTPQTVNISNNNSSTQSISQITNARVTRPIVSRPNVSRPIITKPIQQIQNRQSLTQSQSHTQSQSQSTSLLSLKYRFQHEVLARLGLKFVLPSQGDIQSLHQSTQSTKSTKSAQSTQPTQSVALTPNGTPNSIQFKIHREGIPFDLFAYILVLIAPLSAKVSPYASFPISNPTTLKIINDLFNSISGESLFDEQLLYIYWNIIINIILSYVEVYYIRYWENILNSQTYPIHSLQSIIDKLRSDVKTNHDLNMSNISAHLVKLEDMMMTLINATINHQAKLHNLPQEWNYIPQVIFQRHVKLLFNVILQAMCIKVINE